MTLRRTVGERRPDLLLTIDFRGAYLPILFAWPRTPAIVWVRDPRTSEDIARVSSLRLPDGRSERPYGIAPIDCTSLRWVDLAARVVRRPLHYGTVSPHLGEKIASTYGVMSRALHLLPNIVPPSLVPLQKSKRPQVIFLGRLDPIKRPWLFFDLAERFPAVEFLVLGQLHGRSNDSWQMDDTLPNVRHLGHLEGEEKERALASAWLLVNTSIHEAVAFSFFEALAHRTPIVSCQDGGGLVSRFGIYVGWAAGDGRELLPAFESAIRRMLDDTALRERLGTEGQAWVAETHSADAFVTKLLELGRLSGLPLN
ncbi:MAG: putative glycosyl transferase, group 1 family protein [Proteobacteria bacterium]|nr:putative glycosyl transferase, group 1 family protein [Pseudomonadota bacterium]